MVKRRLGNVVLHSFSIDFGIYFVWETVYPTGSGTNNAPFYYKIFYYKIISMSFCNITISHPSTLYDILGEVFKLKP